MEDLLPHANYKVQGDKVQVKEKETGKKKKKKKRISNNGFKLSFVLVVWINMSSCGLH